MDRIYTKEIEDKIGYQFKDKELLIKAFTHRSYISSSESGSESYERLELIGDSFIELVVTEYLFKRFPSFDQGVLSKLRAQIVSRKSLTKIIEKLDVFRYLRIGDALQGEISPRLRCDLFEAIVGAVFLDSNDYHKTRDFVVTKMKEILEREYYHGNLTDYKSIIFELCAKNSWSISFETTVCMGGFNSTLFVNGVKIGDGKGVSKKEAEQAAAREGYDKIK